MRELARAHIYRLVHSAAPCFGAIYLAAYRERELGAVFASVIEGLKMELNINKRGAVIADELVDMMEALLNIGAQLVGYLDLSAGDVVVHYSNDNSFLPLVGSYQLRLGEDMPLHRAQHLLLARAFGEVEVGVERIERKEVAMTRRLILRWRARRR